MSLKRAIEVFLSYKEAAKEGMVDNYDVDLIQDFIEEAFDISHESFVDRVNAHIRKHALN